MITSEDVKVLLQRKLDVPPGTDWDRLLELADERFVEFDDYERDLQERHDQIRDLHELLESAKQRLREHDIEDDDL